MVQFHVLVFISSFYRIHPGVSHGVTFLIPNHIGVCHWKILIETATDSFKNTASKLPMNCKPTIYKVTS